MDNLEKVEELQKKCSELISFARNNGLHLITIIGYETNESVLMCNQKYTGTREGVITCMTCTMSNIISHSSFLNPDCPN